MGIRRFVERGIAVGMVVAIGSCRDAADPAAPRAVASAASPRPPAPALSLDVIIERTAGGFPGPVIEAYHLRGDTLSVSSTSKVEGSDATQGTLDRAGVVALTADTRRRFEAMVTSGDLLAGASAAHVLAPGAHDTTKIHVHVELGGRRADLDYENGRPGDPRYAEVSALIDALAQQPRR